MSGEFKKCSKGHPYDSELEECPYCNGKELDDDLENLPDKPAVNKDILKNIASCYLIGSRDL